MSIILSIRINWLFGNFPWRAEFFCANYSWRGNVRELKKPGAASDDSGVGEDIELDEVKSALGAVFSDVMISSSVPEFFNLPLKEARDHFEKLIWNII